MSDRKLRVAAIALGAALACAAASGDWRGDLAKAGIQADGRSLKIVVPTSVTARISSTGGAEMSGPLMTPGGIVATTATVTRSATIDTLQTTTALLSGALEVLGRSVLSSLYAADTVIDGETSMTGAVKIGGALTAGDVTAGTVDAAGVQATSLSLTGGAAVDSLSVTGAASLPDTVIDGETSMTGAVKIGGALTAGDVTAGTVDAAGVQATSLSLTGDAAIGGLLTASDGLKAGSTGTSFRKIKTEYGTLPSGETTVSISAAGALPGDIVIGIFTDPLPTNSVFIRGCVAGTDEVTVYASGDPGSDTSVTLIGWRPQ